MIEPVTDARSENLPSIFGRLEAVHAAFEDEAAYHAVIGLGPHHRHVGDRRVGDPHLGAAQLVAAGCRARAGDHAAGVAAVVRFGQAEAADQVAAGQAGQVFFALRLGAERVDRVHHQAGLHAHRRAVGAVDALHFAGDQAVGHVVHAGTAVAFDGGAEQAERAHVAEDLAVEGLVAVGLDDAWHELALAVVAGGVAYGDLFGVELAFEVEGVQPGHFVGLLRGRKQGLLFCKKEAKNSCLDGLANARFR